MDASSRDLYDARVDLKSRETAPAGLGVAIDLHGAALGVQMAVAVMASLFFALLLGLEYPAWATYAVLMLLMARFVGAVHEKSAMSLIGTVLGCCLGFLATGALQQSPILYWPLTFLVVAFSVAMFGQSRAPTAFFLIGLTYVVIVSNSQANPSMAWRCALLRMEEVSLGVVVSMVVQVLVFPRYANSTFSKLIRNALGELAEAVPLGAQHFTGSKTGLGNALRDFPEKSTEMRALARFGAMENRSFQKDIGQHPQKVKLVVMASALVRSLGRHEPVPEPCRTPLEEDILKMGGLLRDGFLALEGDEPLTAEWKSGLSKLWAKLDESVLVLRANPDVQNLESFEAGMLTSHLLTLRELSDLLLELDELGSNPEKKITLEESLVMAPDWPSEAWIHRGIRAGFATVAALVLQNWLNPPGGPLTLLCVFTFTAFNSLSPDESGNRGAIRQAIVFSILLAGGSLALLTTSPMLPSYAAFNIVIGTWAFLFGCWFHRAGGFTVPLTFSFMVLVSIVSLNAQQAVTFQSVADVFFGLVNGTVISAVTQRLLWPVLPQKTLRLGVKRYLEELIEALPGGVARLPLLRRTEHALFPAKARKAIAAMRGSTCPPGEAAKLEEFIHTLQELAWEFTLCIGRLAPVLPTEFSEKGGNAIKRAKETIERGLREMADSFFHARLPENLAPEIESAIFSWEEWMQWLRIQFRELQTPPETAILLMGYSARFRLTLLLLRRALFEARSLRPGDYLGDVAL